MNTIYKYFIAFLILGSTLFAAYSTYSILWKNQTPYSIRCEGILLNKSKVYALSNTDRRSHDTVFIHFENAANIMPKTLAYIYFDKISNEFVVKNNTCIIDGNKSEHINYLLPFCNTKTGTLKPYQANEIIAQKAVIKQGLRYNFSGGTKDTRVSIEFIKTNRGIVLKTNDDGMNVNYHVKCDTVSNYQVCFNQQPSAAFSYIFSFDNTVEDTAIYSIQVQKKGLFIYSTIFDSENKMMYSYKNINLHFFISDTYFSLERRYGIFFTIAYPIFLVIILCFQILLYIKFTKANTPLVQAFIVIRILLNTIVCMGVPVFLHSVIYHDYRFVYLIMVLLLNLSSFIDNTFKLKIKIDEYSILFRVLAGITIVIATIIVTTHTVNETFCKVPILHILKVFILLIYLILPNKNNTTFSVFKIICILTFSFFISKLTHDFGSTIYTLLAIVLIEYVKKSIPVKVLIALMFIVILSITVYFKNNTEIVNEPKNFRIVAPYIQPDSELLTNASEADRESVSSQTLHLKNLSNFNTPSFNDVMIPATLKSTMHSDYVFLASLILGNVYFFILYIIITIALIYHLLFILYCTIYEFRISATEIVSFPKNQWTDVVIFLLAITCISYIYPILSNLLIIPITGQSIPMLSTSWVEVIFILLLLLLLENIFKNTDYQTAEKYRKVQLGYYEVLTFIRSTIKIFILFLVIAISIKAIILNKYHEKHKWNIIENQHQTLSDSLLKDNSKIFTKEELIAMAKNCSDGKNAISIPNKLKPFYKNLAALYHTGKPYYITKKTGNEFKNSTSKCLNQITIASLFNYKKTKISENKHPFGNVFSIQQLVNGNIEYAISNKYYQFYKTENSTVINDLHATCNFQLQQHLNLIGFPNNIGAVMIVENKTGNIITQSSYPFNTDINSNTKYYFAGSLKKILLCYAALTIDAKYYNRIFFSEKQKRLINMIEFIRNSDDDYSAQLLLELLEHHQEEFNDILTKDFNLPLCANNMDDAFFDVLPKQDEYKKELDKYNSIYRISIGMQQPYQFTDVMQWYASIASKQTINFNSSASSKTLSINEESYHLLRKCMNSVLSGTAADVGKALGMANNKNENYICKTGTAEHKSGKYNMSSSFIFSNEDYTIGIMLSGKIPENSEQKSARALFIKLIPTFKDYKILNK